LTAAASKTKRKKPVKREQDDEEDDFIDDDEDESPVKKKKKTKKKAPKPEKAAASKKVKAEKSAAVKPEKKRKAAPDAVTSSKKKKTNDSNNANKANNNNKQLKQLDKTERLQYAMQSFLWWNAPEPPVAGCQWTTMEHAGVSFPEPYVPHGIALLYDGTPIRLTPLQEEAATFFAATDPDGMHLGNPQTAPIFIQNFFADFRAVLGRGHVIQDFQKCDFGPIRRHLEEQKMIKKAITDEERKANKEDRNSTLYQYGFAIVRITIFVVPYVSFRFSNNFFRIQYSILTIVIIIMIIITF